MYKERNIKIYKHINLKDRVKKYQLMEQKDVQVNTYEEREKYKYMQIYNPER